MLTGGESGFGSPEPVKPAKKLMELRCLRSNIKSVKEDRVVGRHHLPTHNVHAQVQARALISTWSWNLASHFYLAQASPSGSLRCSAAFPSQWRKGPLKPGGATPGETEQPRKESTSSVSSNTFLSLSTIMAIQRLPNLASKGQTDEDFVALLLNREG